MNPSSSSSSSSSFSTLLERHMKKPSESEQTQQSSLPSERERSIEVVEKSHVIGIGKHLIPSSSELLSVHGKSSKLHNKKYLTLPQISVEHVNFHNNYCHCTCPSSIDKKYKCSEHSCASCKAGGIKEENNYCPWYSNHCCTGFKGFPEVRRRSGSRSRRGSQSQYSSSEQEQLFYRIPKLLEQAFTPEIPTQYSYKCVVRTNQNILSPQPVTISLLSGVDLKEEEGHFALAPRQSQPQPPSNQQR
ncbi:unnamed protein product [Orchesella dallaii]|uniref:Uncharacterized protein n=1 Tax=Orchesella dallaii TaxID=48710 RepID=A0ABP1S9X9_9HEXA